MFAQGPQYWHLIPDHHSPITDPNASSIYVTWSGLVFTCSLTTLAITQRSSATSHYLNAVGAWLHLPPASRWSSLSKISTGSLPHPHNAVPLFSTILHHVLPRGTPVLGPLAPLVGNCYPHPAAYHQPREPPTHSIHCGIASSPVDLSASQPHPVCLLDNCPPLPHPGRQILHTFSRPPLHVHKAWYLSGTSHDAPSNS